MKQKTSSTTGHQGRRNIIRINPGILIIFLLPWRSVVRNTYIIWGIYGYQPVQDVIFSLNSVKVFALQKEVGQTAKNATFVTFEANTPRR